MGQEGWLNNEVRYVAICHDSKGNVVDGLGNPIKEAEEVVEEEERQEKDEGLEFKPKNKKMARRNTEVASRLYSTNGAYQEPEIYLSLCLR